MLTKIEQIDKFADAVAKGHAVFACPKTAPRLTKALADHGIDLQIQECPYLAEGEVVAVDASQYAIDRLWRPVNV